jgi:uncharacterized membrane protein YfcA
MPASPDALLALAAIAVLAAIVNGALGYGFSSITVPLALLFLSNRVLTPALVPVEVVLNAYVLWTNRDAIPRVARRVRPILIGLLPGVAAGTFVLARIAPEWLKLYTFSALLPIVLLQAAGIRRPVQAERAAGLVFGSGLGAFYAVTTISGPPLAVALNNQGFTKQDFRAALGLVRLAESSLTAVAYAFAGLYTASSLALVPVIVPGVAIGVPIGAALIRRISAETFRRVCMSFDAWIVALGISLLLRRLGLVDGLAAFALPGAVAAIDAWLLYRFLSSPRPKEVLRVA